ncbi:site-specific DNA-methyltransferase [candidate division KSB1 bacterium]|nr:site-specific DNA-methyltransferase [candidate division KSB1 bacterium]
MSLPDRFRNQFICGDCFELLHEVPDECIDLVLTDPPYGIDYQSNRRVAREKLPKFQNDGDLRWVDGWVEQMHRVLKPDTHFYCFTRFDMYPTFYRSISRLFKVKNCLIWAKNNHGSGDLNGSFAPQHEMIIFAAKGTRHLNGPREGDLLDCENVPSAHRLHATQKPVKLLRQLIEKSSDPHGIVLDPFAGTGSTGFACLDTKRDSGDHQPRNFLLFELSEEWVRRGRLGGLATQAELLEIALSPPPDPLPRRQRTTARTGRYRAKKDQTEWLPL